MQKKKIEEKRKKFHEALLHFYHPTPPTPTNQESLGSPKKFDEDPSMLINEDVNFNVDPVSADEEVEEEDCASNTSDCEPKKLTRAQRKRIRKRKLKEAALVRRKYTGPVLPSNYHVSREDHCGEKKKTFGENHQGHMQETS